eukprot:4149104-Ditylum_brightwellii.AAC.1
MERGTNRRVQQIRAECVLKAQACNNQFAQDAPDDQCSFEDALKIFFTSGPIPLIFRAFSEVNKEFLTLLKTTALAIVSTEEELVVSPVKSMHNQ